MVRIKAIYSAHGIRTRGHAVYQQNQREQWLQLLTEPSPTLELLANFFHIAAIVSCFLVSVNLSSLPFSEGRLTLPARIRSFHAGSPEVHAK